METTKVGIREFREQLGSYLESAQPVAITKHGRTVGFYIPVHRAPELEEREAGRRLDAWMAEKKVSESELVEDFEHSRKTSRARGR
jgi:antitoxin (DNA-binding transcriptional repressor) of toxin-antitoxin stability system